jgi:serine phosphatase RsbU (regulator of sigma subunit)
MLDNKLYISSANRPVYIIQDNIITEIKPDKRSIGGSHSSNEFDFKVNEIDIQPNMMIYMFSDGYADQFGGEAGKKFKVKKLGELLLEIHRKPLEEQHKILNSAFEAWKNKLEQVDDVCIIGIRF